MIKKTESEIISKVKELWPPGEFSNQQVDITFNDDTVVINISHQYEAPGLTFKVLRQLADFFGTDNINDSPYNYRGCHTCDYGSKYGFHLYIRPE